jgi:excisionase family DNA binding protein
MEEQITLDTDLDAAAEDEEIMTPEEAAAYLKVGKWALYRSMKSGTVPAKKIGGVWRLSKRALNKMFYQGLGPDGDI